MIIQTQGNLIDFAVPIAITEDQKKKIVAYCKNNFNAEIINTTEKSKEVNRKKIIQKSWTEKDIALLFSSKSTERVGAELGRSSMSIIMARGNLLPEISSWAKKKGKPLPLSKNDIKLFLEDRK